LVAGLVGVLAGVAAFKQMDDKPGVPVLADFMSSLRGRPLGVPEAVIGRGAFIVFEGGEGAGKSTQVELLAQALIAQGREVMVTREPGATEVGARIRSLLLDRLNGPLSVAPRSEALLYAADRADHVASVVRPALATGSVVISDRYIDSSLAYQGAGRTLPAEEISWLSAWATGGLKPDLVVLLDIDPAAGLSRVDGRGSADRLEVEAPDFHERVRYKFLDLAAADPRRYLVVDATRPRDQIAAKVIGRVETLLPGPEFDDSVPAPPPARTIAPEELIDPYAEFKPSESGNGHHTNGHRAVLSKLDERA
jgi:dTMP kinase